MSRDTKTENTESRRSSDMERRKDEIRRNKIGQTRGKLSIPVHLRKAGFHYCAANTSAKSNEVEKMKGLGYEIVTDPNMVVGDRGLTTGHHFGSGIMVDLGKDPNGLPMEGILMEIPDELYQVSLDVEREKVKRIEDEIGAPVEGMDEVFKFIND